MATGSAPGYRGRHGAGTSGSRSRLSVVDPRSIAIHNREPERLHFKMPPCSMTTTELGRNGASLN
jgi:hypothetical protein